MVVSDFKDYTAVHCFVSGLIDTSLSRGWKNLGF